MIISYIKNYLWISQSLNVFFVKKLLCLFAKLFIYTIRIFLAHIHVEKLYSVNKPNYLSMNQDKNLSVYLS